MNIKAFIPNFITLLNLFSGSVAVIFAVNNHFIFAAFFVFLGIFFDFFDGLLARKLNVQSDLGLQLDSLADMVTSGLVPGIVVFKLLELASNSKAVTSIDEWSETMQWTGYTFNLLPFIGLFITLASAYRLARFNLDEEQQSYFKGLPTPANALLILSLPLILEFQNNDLINSIILNKWFLIVLTILSCYILNSSVKLFALKFKNWSFKSNAVRYIFIILSIVLLVVLHFAAIPLIIILYILLSLFNNIN
ncbi:MULTISPECIES: CDP-alcohol phosphatidyltransferase family protein [unclassified Olleya]|jgi:CDP-diacylglycerol--serine O-phosphatidyltransferase|uniref:CDP-alcohol phosphatidyltransferase family protein n=1 Tax=unclassified Olleya TaxID=2615019 RepID=UPI0025D4925B|nr:CDP-alcohol phosphatidyltransferase family protein [Olleya sp. UBA1516]|tara:strand:- start:11877 stop:12626 length:750 start_codon:yes stop_codon:yes gene_type:complete